MSYILIVVDGPADFKEMMGKYVESFNPNFGALVVTPYADRAKMFGTEGEVMEFYHRDSEDDWPLGIYAFGMIDLSGARPLERIGPAKKPQPVVVKPLTAVAEALQKQKGKHAVPAEGEVREDRNGAPVASASESAGQHDGEREEQSDKFKSDVVQTAKASHGGTSKSG